MKRLWVICVLAALLVVYAATAFGQYANLKDMHYQRGRNYMIPNPSVVYVPVYIRVCE